ncbi:hypothetical protein [Salinibaculum rarum]|uniref:hypothetical protein n=1 Tax=Salinibaculum rarum TaxID=3058903 RepID=UPI00265FD44B|nr:hypothetical protein [Salinibaculum sp. KK48]
MDEDPFFCEDCDEQLSHDEIQTVTEVPQVNIESFEMSAETVDVHQCRGCGLVIGFEPR